MNKKIVLGLLSLGRTDYSYFKPILKQIISEDSLEYFLITTSMHLSPEFGLTYKEILKDGFRIDERIEATVSSNTPEGTAKTTALEMLGIAPILGRGILDALLVVGDRYETLAAVVTALFYNLPIIHIAGGDVTEGTFDEQVRHAITKIADIHLTTNDLSRRRIIQMGEEDWRVYNVGSPCIDMIKQTKLYPRREFLDLYRLCGSKMIFLVTFHPVTLDAGNTDTHINNLIKALTYFDADIIATYPNSDPGSRSIIDAFKRVSGENKNIRFIKNLGIKGYYSAMKYADVMLGNSSSGIIESATFKLPVVNIGNRQKDRLCAKNVLNSDYKTEDIIRITKRAISKEFRLGLSGIKNPYGEGNSSSKIISIIKGLLSKKTNREIITKKFILKGRR